MNKLIIREAEIEDLGTIVFIHNNAIKERQFTAMLTPFDIQQRVDWFHQHGSTTFPLLVAALEGKVVGWMSSEPYRQGREALRNTCEISYFVDAKYRKRGIGKTLLMEMTKNVKLLGFTTMIAVTFHNNEGSNNLLRTFGFELWGNLPKVVEIDGITRDHLYFGLHL